MALTIVAQEFSIVPVHRFNAKLFPGYPESKIAFFRVEFTLPTTELGSLESPPWVVGDDVIIYAAHITQDFGCNSGEDLVGFSTLWVLLNSGGFILSPAALPHQISTVGVSHVWNQNEWLPGLHLPLEEDDEVKIRLEADNNRGNAADGAFSAWVQLYYVEKR